MALYALAAREQKTPYITNSVYSTALIVLAAILFSTLGKVLYAKYPYLANIFTVLGLVVFALGILNVFFRVWQARNRKLNFRDDQLLKSLKLVRRGKNIWRRFRGQPTYEHDPIGLRDPLLSSIMKCQLLPEEQLKAAVERSKGIDNFALSLSAGCQASTLTEADQLIAELALCFLQHECWVQYTSCTRHPIEFISHLKKSWQAKFNDKDWKQVVDHILAVDAYSPHFGFTDSIHDEATNRLNKLGVKCITSKASYAGLHSAAARAFNTIRTRSKKRDGHEVRSPTLVVYDGPHALVELESSEQYRIFIRHLVPSERLWGGMFTLVVESVIDEQDLTLLRSYTDLFIDLSGDMRSGKPAVGLRQAGEQ